VKTHIKPAPDRERFRELRCPGIESFNAGGRIFDSRILARRDKMAS